MTLQIHPRFVALTLTKHHHLFNNLKSSNLQFLQDF